MSQNINLYAAAFRKQRPVVTLNTVAACVTVALLALGLARAYLEHEATGLAQELRGAEALFKAQRAYADRLQGEAAARQKNPALEAETTRLETELKLARDAMDALRGGAIGTQEGFAEYLRALSRQSVNGLWLTGLTIGGGEIEIRGRVLSPDLVPDYIQRLNREKVLAGRSFDRLEMARPHADPAKDKDPKAATRAPRYLEFSLATAAPAKGEKTP
jgi:hypothetical protein